MIGLAAIAAGVLLIDQTRVFPGLWVLLPVAGTALLIAVGPRAWINRSILSLPPIVWVGLISYPLYLWHWPLLSFAHILLGDIPPASLRLALARGQCRACVGHLPCDRTADPLRHTRQRVAVPALGLAMSVACAAGIAVYSSGRRDRSSGQSQRRGAARRLLRAAAKDGTRRGLPSSSATSWTGDEHVARGDRSVVHGGRLRIVRCSSGAIPSRRRYRWAFARACRRTPHWRRSQPPAAAPRSITSTLTVPDRRCESHEPVRDGEHRRLQPDVVIVAQAGGHDLDRLAGPDLPRSCARRDSMCS